MLTTHDVGELFQAMRTVYGNQWKHGPQAVEVWRRALSKFDAPDVMAASMRGLEFHKKHPPTLPEFLELLADRKPARTYLPPPNVDASVAASNRALLETMLEFNGVDGRQLETMIGIKNAMVEELGQSDITDEWLENTKAELVANAKLMDRNLRAAESAQAAERFRVKQGMPAI